MNKTVVIDIVGLSTSLIGEHTPFLKKYISSKNITTIEPLLPAVTTSVQSAYLTGKYPVDNGIVGNGWYDRIDSEVKFWKQSNKLVAGDKIWDKAKKEDPSFTSSMMFWWYNMYSSADYSVTPRPITWLTVEKCLIVIRTQPNCVMFFRRNLVNFHSFNFGDPEQILNQADG
jgi:predicted AlkP superfamily pyrophosphatase or phosphodiesterase